MLSLFLTLIHLGFASATALASAMIPIVIAVLQGVATPGINIVGMTMLLQFVVSFGFILVVNAPQNMVAYGTETFDAKDFVRTGLVLTVIALALGHAARRDLLALARLRLMTGIKRRVARTMVEPNRLVRLRSRCARATPDTPRPSVLRGCATRSPKGEAWWCKQSAANLSHRFLT